MSQENENLISVKENMQIAIPHEEALKLYASASNLKLTDDENTKLLALFDEKEIEIRPDGHIYLPQSFYRNRLNQSLGIGQWALIIKAHTQEESGTPDKKKIKMLLNGILVIRGCFVAEAVGEAEMHLSNENQSLGTVWEAAKSDCITRCCKDLSIGQQGYQPTFIREWQKKYAIQVWVKDKRKPHWRKIDAPPFFDEIGPVDPAKPFPFQHPTNQRKWLNKKWQSGAIAPEWDAAVQGLTDGSLTIAMLEETYKINRELRTELEAIVANAGKGSAPAQPAAASAPEQPKTEEKKVEAITGDVYAQLEKCKFKEDVDQLAVKYQLKIQANKNWRDVFVSAKTKLKSKPIKA